jgi:hypothetical protein
MTSVYLPQLAFPFAPEPETESAAIGSVPALRSSSRAASSFMRILCKEHMADLKVEDVHSLSDSKRRTPEFLKQMRSTRRPIVLTLHGRAEVTVPQAKAYQEWLNYMARLVSNCQV